MGKELMKRSIVIRQRVAAGIVRDESLVMDRDSLCLEVQSVLGLSWTRLTPPQGARSDRQEIIRTDRRGGKESERSDAVFEAQAKSYRFVIGSSGVPLVRKWPVDMRPTVKLETVAAKQRGRGE